MQRIDEVAMWRRLADKGIKAHSTDIGITLIEFELHLNFKFRKRCYTREYNLLLYTFINSIEHAVGYIYIR